MATLADVAALAGVSKATASRAFSRPDMVSPATARRVTEAARKLDFVANRAATQLAGGRTGLLALTVPSLENSYFTPVIAGAQREADNADLQLSVVVHPLRDSGELPAVARLQKQIDGMVVVAPVGSDELVQLASGSTPTVLVDREIDGFDSVRVGTPEAFATMVTALVSAGLRRIVYVGGPAGSWQDAQRVRAVESAVSAAGGHLEVVSSYEPTFAAGVTAAGEVRQATPDAVVPYATAVGLGIQHAYLMAGDRAPLVTSEREVAAALELEVPTIDLDGEELGRQAVKLLMSRMTAPSASHERHLLEATVALPHSMDSGPVVELS